MSKLIDQIKFFHNLNLQPISKQEIEKWNKAIEENLIIQHGIKDCHVSIYQRISVQKRKRKKPFCKMCKMCEK